MQAMTKVTITGKHLLVVSGDNVLVPTARQR
jgi:hypothetical protein